MDLGTIIGISAGFACIIISIATGGSGGAFFHIPSMMVVVGGMLASTLMHFNLSQVMRIGSITKKTLFASLPSEHDLVQQMVNFSAINRRDGSLALEKQIKSAKDKFFQKGLRMVVDGQTEENIQKQLGIEIDALRERHMGCKQVLEFMGASAPAFGMIGTLIGLVQMLGTLEDPSSIGAGMATALITTFYGAVLANLVFIPLAGKLGIYSRKEAQLREMIVEGIVGIAAGEAPTAVKDRMQSFMQTSKRFNVKPKI